MAGAQSSSRKGKPRVTNLPDKQTWQYHKTMVKNILADLEPGNKSRAIIQLMIEGYITSLEVIAQDTKKLKNSSEGRALFSSDKFREVDHFNSSMDTFYKRIIETINALNLAYEMLDLIDEIKKKDMDANKIAAARKVIDGCLDTCRESLEEAEQRLLVYLI